MSKKCYIIKWQHPVFPEKDRYLFQNEQGEVLLLILPDKATHFDREEVNAVVLGLNGTCYWAAVGVGSYPAVKEVSG